MISSTYFALMAEFGTAEIELERLCDKFFGLSQSEAKRRAARHGLPVPAHRAGGQKSGWLINAADLAAHLDKQRAIAESEWKKARTM
jgi:hypothetical protein